MTIASRSLDFYRLACHRCLATTIFTWTWTPPSGDIYIGSHEPPAAFEMNQSWWMPCTKVNVARSFIAFRYHKCGKIIKLITQLFVTSDMGGKVCVLMMFVLVRPRENLQRKNGVISNTLYHLIGSNQNTANAKLFMSLNTKAEEAIINWWTSKAKGAWYECCRLHKARVPYRFESHRKLFRFAKNKQSAASCIMWVRFLSRMHRFYETARD